MKPNPKARRMKLLLPAYGNAMQIFAQQAAREFASGVAVIINPDSGPGELADLAGASRSLYMNLHNMGAETWLYIDAITGPQYSPFIDAGGKLITPKTPRTKTETELKRELARYTQGNFTDATGIFVDDTTTEAHRDLITKAFTRRALMPNPGNWQDAQRFRNLPETTGLVIFEASAKWTPPPLPKGQSPEPGLAVLCLNCRPADWRAQMEAAAKWGASYFYATDKKAPWDNPASYASDLAKAVTSL